MNGRGGVVLSCYSYLMGRADALNDAAQADEDRRDEFLAAAATVRDAASAMLRDLS